MCLSTAYVETGKGMEEVLRDVAFLEAEDNGFMLVTLMGDRNHVEGRIRSIDFMNEHTIVFER